METLLQLSFLGDTEEDNIILAALFAVPGALSREELGRALGVSSEKAGELLADLLQKLRLRDGAFLLREIGDKYELCANDKYFDRISPLVARRSEPELTESMLEVLAIIAEKGQATRVDIEEIRGVKSDFGVAKLIEYGLIEEKGRLNMPGRPIVFGLTDEFSRRFGMRDGGEFPEFAENSPGGEEGDSLSGSGRESAKEEQALFEEDGVSARTDAKWKE